ncbi:MAG: beta-ketoacyl synthase N-terminal-like domain-containing protein [Nitrospinota bacterium]
MNKERVVVVASEMVTPYGWGVEACWKGLFSKKTAVSRLKRFSTKAFQSDYAGTVKGLEYHRKESLVIQMIEGLFKKAPVKIPEGTRLILATAKGEVDLLEKQLINGKDNVSGTLLNSLVKKVSGIFGMSENGAAVLSAACVSSTAAVAKAAGVIRSKRADSVMVVTCDSVTEFVFSGFSSLMALDKNCAKPFDKKRNGLTLGEAAAFILVMSESKARREGREIFGEVAGWGLSNDANHMTGPSRDGSGLTRAIKKALQKADINEKTIGSISSHGTGTIYNDAMEMKAFRTIFGNNRRPVYSIKGGIGHSMGAAGLVEMIIALRTLRSGISPPTVNLNEVDEDARGWVSPFESSLDKYKMVLSTNSGFGGVNAALVLA